MKGKPLRIYISKDKWNNAKHSIRDGILKKLSIAKQTLIVDKETAAGIYIYALEEFGKLLLLKNCKTIGGKYIIKYRNEFINHKIKFNKAFDYLQNNNSYECVILNNESNYTSDPFLWEKFLSETDGFLSIFYIDFSISKNNNDKYDIIKIPKIDADKLNDAINELKNVIDNFEI